MHEGLRISNIHDRQQLSCVTFKILPSPIAKVSLYQQVLPSVAPLKNGERSEGKQKYSISTHFQFDSSTTVPDTVNSNPPRTCSFIQFPQREKKHTNFPAQYNPCMHVYAYILCAHKHHCIHTYIVLPYM